MATAVISSVVSLGATLEATAVVDITIATASTVNSIDDATTDNSGKTASQRMCADNSRAKGQVDFVKNATLAVSVSRSSKKIAKIVKDAIKRDGGLTTDF